MSHALDVGGLGEHVDGGDREEFEFRMQSLDVAGEGGRVTRYVDDFLGRENLEDFNDPGFAAGPWRV